jgi:hypothetical protein
MYDPRCKKCHLPLLSEDEIEYEYCESCLDAIYEKEQERREWNYYHNE